MLNDIKSKLPISELVSDGQAEEGPRDLKKAFRIMAQ